MPTLVFRFPGGRYHATASGHHVNEGVVEWPPSPWRLTRALIACGYATQGWTEIPESGRRLFESLSSVLPEYRLPAAALGHSRHYMPTGSLEKGREKTTLVLDTFADVGEGELWVRWDVQLDPEASSLLTTLVENLGYLGRSESWVLGQMVRDDIALPERGRAFPHMESLRPGRGYEQLSLVAPENPADYAAWRAREVSDALSSLGDAVLKKTAAARKKRQQVEDAYPPDLLACLQCDTAWWKERRWSQAPGSRRVLYWREATALEVGPPLAPQRPRIPRIEAMLFALSTPSRSLSALPPVVRTLPQADLLHQALVSKLGYGGGDGDEAPELTGRSPDGTPLRGHQHAHLLPLDLDRDGRLDHIVAFAPMGFGPRAQRALRAVKRTYTKGGVGELQLAVAGQGTLDDLRRLDGRLGASITEILGPGGGATTWISATPFVPPRFIKRRGRNTIEGQVTAELDARGFSGVTVEILPWTSEVAPLRHYVRCRARGAQPPVDAGFALRLKFDAPVRGPICLGYASHFGLGRFVAEPAG